MEVMLALALVLGATFVILNSGTLAEKLPFAPSCLGYINTQVRFQTLLFGIAMAMLAALYIVDSSKLLAFLSVGDIAAPAHAVAWLAIPEGFSWLLLGCMLVFVITGGTTTFVYLQFRKGVDHPGQLLAFMPWVLLFSLTNSFSEEVIYRLGVIVPLAGHIDPAWIMLISAVLFGAPHLRGMPNGLLGASMAGFLGWLLAKSLLETGGLFWAWSIHFLQDVVIFSAFVMAALSGRSKRELPA